MIAIPPSSKNSITRTERTLHSEGSPKLNQGFPFRQQLAKELEKQRCGTAISVRAICDARAISAPLAELFALMGCV
jgi:hypothetical protein